MIRISSVSEEKRDGMSESLVVYDVVPWFLGWSSEKINSGWFDNGKCGRVETYMLRTHHAL